MNEELEGIVADMLAKGATQQEIDDVVTVYDEQYAQPQIEEKKNPDQTSPETGGESNLEGISSDLPEQVQVPDELKLEQGEINYDQPQPMEQVEGATTVEEEPTVEEQPVEPTLDNDPPEKEDGLAMLSAKGGLNNLNQALTSPLESIYNIFAFPQNAVAWAFDKPEWSASADKFKETTGLSNPILDMYEKEGKEIRAKKEEFVLENYQSGSIYENIEKGNYMDALELTGSGVLESAPISLAIMASGGTYGLARTAAGTTVALMDSQRKQLKEMYPNMSEAELSGKAFMMSAAESVFASVGTGTIGQVYKDILKKEGAAVGTEIFKKGLTETYKNLMKKFGAPVGALGEGIEEAVTQISQNMISGRPPMEGVADAFIIGTASGGIMTAPINIKKVLDRKAAKKKAALEGGSTALNIPAVDENGNPIEYSLENEGIPNAEPMAQPADNQGVVTPENGANETGQGNGANTQATDNVPATKAETGVTTTTEAEETGNAGKFYRVTEEAEARSEKATNDKKRSPINKLRAIFTTRRPEMEQALRRLGMTEAREAMDAVAGYKPATAMAVAENNTISEPLSVKKKLEVTDDTGKKVKVSERSLFDKVNKARAIIAIRNRYESDPVKNAHLKDVTHMGGLTVKDAEAIFEDLRDSQPEAFEKIMDASYFYETRFSDLLTEAEAEGLITKDLKNDLKDHFYSPRKVIDFVIDHLGEIESGGSFYNEQDLSAAINKSLSGFSQNRIKGGTEAYDEMDSMFLLNLYTAAQKSRISRNRANREFANTWAKTKAEYEANPDSFSPRRKKAVEQMKKDIIEDTLLGFKNNKPDYAIKKTPRGFAPIYYYNDGVQGRFFIKTELQEQFMDTMSKGTPAGGAVIRWVSGSASVKLFATGVNLAFMYANIPMEFAHAALHSSVYQADKTLGIPKFSFLPKQAARLGKDYMSGMKSSFKKDSDYKSFITNGGGQLFKTLEARRIIAKKTTMARFQGASKTMVGKELTKLKGIVDFAFDIQQATEEGIRIAIFKRRKKQLMDAYLKDNSVPVKKGESGIPKKVLDGMNRDAIARSREIADFNRGSLFMKQQVENFIPYSNVTAQATDAVITAFRKNPVGTTLNHIQAAAFIPTAAVGMSYMMFQAFKMMDDDDELKGLSFSDFHVQALNQQSEYTQNKYFTIPIPIKSANGNWQVMPIRKVESMSFAVNFAEEMLNRKIAEGATISKYIERELPTLLVEQAAENFLPSSVKPSFRTDKPITSNLLKVASSMPFISATGAALGVDVYRGAPLSYGNKSEYLEGRDSERIQPFYKDLSDMTLESPARIQKMVESYITTPNTNPFVGGIYESANSFSNYKTENDLDGNPIENIIVAMGRGFKKRVIKEGYDYNALTKMDKGVNREDAKQEIAIENLVNKSSALLTKAIENPSMTEEEIEAEFEKNLSDYKTAVPDYTEAELMQSADGLRDALKEKKGYSPVIFKIMFQPTDRMKARKMAEYFGDNLLEGNLEKIIKDDPELIPSLYEAKVLTPEVIEFYEKFVKEME